MMYLSEMINEIISYEPTKLKNVRRNYTKEFFWNLKKKIFNFFFHNYI